MYFQTPRALGHGANSIESDLDNLTMAQFVAAREGRHQFYFNVQIERDSFINWIKSMLASKLTLSQSIPKKKKGRRPLYDWAPVQRWVFELMDHHEEFLPGDREWDAQARLEEKISEKMNNDDGPSESLVREHVSKYLKRLAAPGVPSAPPSLPLLRRGSKENPPLLAKRCHPTLSISPTRSKYRVSSSVSRRRYIRSHDRRDGLWTSRPKCYCDNQRSPMIERQIFLKV
jgi:hypothetical protein